MRKRLLRRRPAPPVAPAGASVLLGQLLFAEHFNGTFTVDCLLAGELDRPANPVAFMVRFPAGARNTNRALELLNSWAASSKPVSVTVSELRSGTLVEIATNGGRVILEPDTTAPLPT